MLAPRWEQLRRLTASAGDEYAASGIRNNVLLELLNEFDLATRATTRAMVTAGTLEVFTEPLVGGVLVGIRHRNGAPPHMSVGMGSGEAFALAAAIATAAIEELARLEREAGHFSPAVSGPEGA